MRCRSSPDEAESPNTSTSTAPRVAAATRRTATSRTSPALQPRSGRSATWNQPEKAASRWYGPVMAARASSFDQLPAQLGARASTSTAALAT
jgi:hypothetical protein